MEKARQAVSSFVSGDGKHKTIVDEDVRPSITDEHVRPHRHENIMTALDKEIHQHHHHTVVQPIKHVESLPEKHTHHSIPVEHKVFHHGNERSLRDILDRDIAKYRSTSVTHDTTHTSATAPVVTGERIHHHVHEHVQPVIQKETIAREVVHTTVPIHETHHAEAVHHGTSTLPVKTMEEWTKEGGVLSGRAVKVLSDAAGCPAPYNKELQAEQLDADRDLHPSILGHTHGSGGVMGENLAAAGAATAGAGAGAGTGTGTGTGIGAEIGDGPSKVVTDTDIGAMGTGTRSGTRSGTDKVTEAMAATGLGLTGATGATGAAADTGMGTDGAGYSENMPSESARGPTDTRRGENVTSTSSHDISKSSRRAGGISPTSPASDKGGHYALGGGNTATGGSAVSAPRSSTLDTAERQKPYVDSLGVRSGSQAKAKRHASLVDKLNPFTDADGDGKRGFMD